MLDVSWHVLRYQHKIAGTPSSERDDIDGIPAKFRELAAAIRTSIELVPLYDFFTHLPASPFPPKTAVHKAALSLNWLASNNQGDDKDRAKMMEELKSIRENLKVPVSYSEPPAQQPVHEPV